MNRTAAAASLLALALGAAACGGGSSGSASSDLDTKGPIKVWLSNNPEEIAWGKAMVAAWNAKNPKEKVTAQEIPAGKTSEEVIGAAITAGNAPCLVFNTSPAAVPQFQKQGGLVALDDFPGGAKYIEARSGKTADQYKSLGREVLPDPVEVQPGDDLLQQGPAEEGRGRPGEPAAVDVRRLPRDQRQDRVQQGGAGGDLAGADQRVLPVLVRLLPALRRRDGWHAAGGGRQGDLRQRRRQGGLGLLGHDVPEGLRPQGEVQRRLVRRRQGGDGHRRPVGDRGVRRQGELGRSPRADVERARPRTRRTPSRTPRTSRSTRRARPKAPRGTC